ncbi:M20 aminoacylase family protein [Ruegeria arenilitoris]|uniref:M20 aminoacylase family protein n=1 Tax=Ruegeria arenilitoris TaxID=1173585 RepID=UPI0014802736|nr:M20 aminoacylase family protein [Ruegeria arenilitoris]
MPIKNRLAEMHQEITGWRQDFHQNPEILYETHRTSGLVAERLKEFGCDEVVTGIGRTGVVGVIKGKTDTKGSVIGLRADMDALPMQEQTGLEYASKVDGAMHACGHDGHTAMVLGAAKYLSETRNFDGTAVVIFQPAEEGGKGAEAMCQDGLMDRFGIQEVYAMHNVPGLPVGQFAIRSGPLLAAADEFEINLEGQGGHAAEPNETIDTTVMLSQLIVALQTIVSRNVDPTLQAVVSVTSVETSSNAFNVIPQSARVGGTVRTHSNETRDLIEKRLGEVAQSVAKTFGGSAKATYTHGVPVTINAEEQTGYAAQAAISVGGSCGEAPMVMGGEDFSFMLEERPGAFIVLGNGDSAGLHHPEYNFNDEIIPIGCSWFAEMVERRMPAA